MANTYWKPGAFVSLPTPPPQLHAWLLREGDPLILFEFVLSKLEAVWNAQRYRGLQLVAPPPLLYHVTISLHGKASPASSVNFYCKLTWPGKKGEKKEDLKHF